MLKLIFKVMAPLLVSLPAMGFPNICDVVLSGKFNSMLDFDYSYTSCKGWPLPRPCARFNYYIPKYFIEVVNNPKQTYFSKLPGVAAQLKWMTKSGPPSGTDDDMGSYSFHAHTIRIPFASWAFSGLPCPGELPDLFCFSAMSEHLGSNWKTGTADMWQPKFLAWSLKPKACLVAGALTSAGGSWHGGVGKDASTCSFPIDWLPKYPPSLQPVCTGWGVHFPRTGTVTSSDPTTASLVVASRIKSIGAEVFRSVTISGDEKWQMVYPQMSSAFREGQNIAYLRTRGVTEIGRLSGKLNNYLYAVWQKTTCKRDIPFIVEAKLWIRGMKAACEAIK